MGVASEGPHFLIFYFMKYLFALLVSFVCFTSCIQESVDNSNMSIHEFTYNGHSYIEFKPLYSYGSSVIHNPNCPCHDKQL